VGSIGDKHLVPNTAHVDQNPFGVEKMNRAM